MKSKLMAVSLAILGLSGPLNPLWFPYGAFIPASHGNPNSDAYVGQPGSTYDQAANPPQTIGRSQYNPYATLPSMTPNSPSGSANAALPR